LGQDQADGASDQAPDARISAAMFAAIYPALRRYAAMWASNECEPDDLVQEAVLRMLRAGSPVEDPKAYLRIAIANIARNQYRNRDRVAARASKNGPSYISTIDVYPSDLGWLANLAPAERAALFLVDMERLDYRAAAQYMDVSTRRLRALLRRARQGSRLEVDRLNSDAV